jgi:hypothetical protein
MYVNQSLLFSIISIFSQLFAISSKSFHQVILNIFGNTHSFKAICSHLIEACFQASSASKANTILLLTLLRSLICCSVRAVQQVATAFS